MTDDNSMQEGQDVGVWPGRYWVYAQADRYPHRGYIYKDVHMKLFRHNMSEEEKMALLEPFDFTPEVKADPYFKSQVEDTFSEEEADQLIAYMHTYSGTKAKKEPAPQPSEHVMGVGCLSVGGGDDFYMLSEEKDYALPFDAWAYFDVRDCEYLGKTALGGLKEQIDINLHSLTDEEVQELKDYIDKSHKKGHRGYYDR